MILTIACPYCSSTRIRPEPAMYKEKVVGPGKDGMPKIIELEVFMCLDCRRLFNGEDLEKLGKK
jgi:hypothetical protein